MISQRDLISASEKTLWLVSMSTFFFSRRQGSASGVVRRFSRPRSFVASSIQASS